MARSQRRSPEGRILYFNIDSVDVEIQDPTPRPCSSPFLRCLTAPSANSVDYASRQIEAQRGVDDDIAAGGRVTDTAPQAAMHIRHLVAVRVRAELALKEAIPVASHHPVEMSIVAATGIERHFVRATRETHERRPVARRGS